MENLTKEKKGEIAYKLFLKELKTKEISIFSNPNDLKEELGNLSKELDIPLEELRAFYKMLLTEALNKLFENLD